MLSGATNASELGRALSVTKQAAARTIVVLEDRGYLVRESGPLDGHKIHVTESGPTVLQKGQRVFDEMRAEAVANLGAEALEAFEDALRHIAGEDRIRLGTLGWTAHGLNDDGATP